MTLEPAESPPTMLLASPNLRTREAGVGGNPGPGPLGNKTLGLVFSLTLVDNSCVGPQKRYVRCRRSHGYLQKAPSPQPVLLAWPGKRIVVYFYDRWAEIIKFVMNNNRITLSGPSAMIHKNRRTREVGPERCTGKVLPHLRWPTPQKRTASNIPPSFCRPSTTLTCWRWRHRHCWTRMTPSS